MEVKFKNQLNTDVLDKDFYLLLFNNIVNLKNYINKTIWRQEVCLSWYKYEILACACLDTSKFKMQPWRVLVLIQVICLSLVGLNENSFKSRVKYIDSQPLT